MTNQNTETQLMDVALRIREMREILGYSTQKMAELTEISEDLYRNYDITFCCKESKLLLLSGQL